MSNKSFNEDKINEVSDTNNEVEKDIANEQQELNIDNNSENDQDLYDEIKKLKISLDEQTIKADEYLDLLKRKAAEFENFRKRTIKEKSEIYVNAFCDAIKIFLPVIDNFERALVCDENASEQSLKDGMELIYKQLNEILKSNGVDEIESVGKEFDPNLHAAMLHIEDESVGENTIVDQFQKGYIYKDKVIRHSSVKVAN